MKIIRNIKCPITENRFSLTQESKGSNSNNLIPGLRNTRNHFMSLLIHFGFSAGECRKLCLVFLSQVFSLFLLGQSRRKDLQWQHLICGKRISNYVLEYYLLYQAIVTLRHIPADSLHEKLALRKMLNLFFQCRS